MISGLSTDESSTRGDGPKVVLLGFTVPEAHLEGLGRSAAVSAAQTHNFAWSLVDALTESDCAVSLLSTLPLRNYPTHPALLLKGQTFDSHGRRGRLLGFINVAGAKHVSRFVACVCFGIAFIRSCDAGVLMVHGVHTPFLWFARLARRWLRLPVVVVLTDPPGVVQPLERSVTKAMRRLDVRLVRRALRGVDGVISLTEALGHDFAPRSGRLVMEGIVNPRIQISSMARKARLRDGSPFAVGYAGSLKEEYGVRRLVEAVLSTTEDIVLDLYGVGPLEAWIGQQADGSSRLRFHGPVPHEELVGALMGADLLVNPRPVDQEFVKYSFPSKLIEYMAIGRPVLTTKLPGIPADYAGKLLLAEDDSTEGLMRALGKAARMPTSDLEALGCAGQEFVLNEKSANSQGKRIREFLDQLVRGHV